MRPVLVLALGLFLTACVADEDDRPTIPGGGGGGGGSTGGGGGSDADAGSIPDDVIAGRLCPADDLRSIEECVSSTALAGVQVAIEESGASTSSSANGDFQLPDPQRSSATMLIGGGDDGAQETMVIVPTAGPPQNLRLPTVSDADWEALLAAAGVVEPQGSASLLLHLVDDAGAPVSGVEVLSPIGASVPPLYAGSDGPNDWSPGGLTDASGAVLLLGLPIDQPTLSVTVISNEAGTIPGIPVRADYLSIVSARVP